MRVIGALGHLFWLERGQSKTVKGQDFFHVLKGRPLSCLVCFGLACFHDKGKGRGEAGPLPKKPGDERRLTAPRAFD